MQEKREISREDSKKETNRVTIKGRIAEEFKFDHAVKWEKFFATRIAVRRKSGTEDMVPVIISEVYLNPEILSGKYTTVEMKGEFRSYNKLGEDGKSHLSLFLFAKEVDFIDDEEDNGENEIFLQGYLCKTPIYRSAHKSNRDIADLIIAVNRQYGKSDYIPCIAWGRNAKRVALMQVGDCIELKGRIQSRKYSRKDSSNSAGGELREVYEISISDVHLIEE